MLLGAFVVFGRGLGASGAMTRTVARLAHVVAPRWVDANGHLGGYFAHGANWWDDWLIFEVVGVALGGLAAAPSPPAACAWASTRARASPTGCA